MATQSSTYKDSNDKLLHSFLLIVCHMKNRMITIVHVNSSIISQLTGIFAQARKLSFVINCCQNFLDVPYLDISLRNSTHNLVSVRNVYVCVYV